MARVRPARPCSAHRKNGEPCRNFAIVGGRVCPAHGGRAPQVRAAAAERELDRRVRRELARLEAEPCENPLTALAKLAGEVWAWKDALAAKVNELAAVRYRADGAGTEQLRAEVAIF